MMKVLKDLIEENDNKVLTPKLVENLDNIRLLKIDLGDIPHFKVPHPLLLGFKTAICLHKFAACMNPTLYESKEHDVKEYVKKSGSMMLVHGCGELDLSPCELSDLPSEISIPVTITNQWNSDE